jgi:hypothetical protein
MPKCCWLGPFSPGLGVQLHKAVKPVPDGSLHYDARRCACGSAESTSVRMRRSTP